MTEAVKALSRTRTAPVGESMPVVIGGREVATAIHKPPTQPPISIAQIATGIPAFKSPGNMSAPNEMMLPISTTEATSPAIVVFDDVATRSDQSGPHLGRRASPVVL